MSGRYPPDEVLAEPAKDEEYIAWRAETDLRAPYRLPPEFLRGTKKDPDYELQYTPLIVFINARSGGRVGPELASCLSRALGRSQVFDLAQHRPDKVLRKIYANLTELQAAGNQQARFVRENLRILACGGDGTVAWIMKVVKQLNLNPEPAIAVMPLGTGNDLSRTLHWGREFLWSWIKGHTGVYNTLNKVAKARVVDLDCWKLKIVVPGKDYQLGTNYSVTEVPGASADGKVTYEGLFWNYFSIGADAQSAYKFHHLREQAPSLTSSRILNQFWYSIFSVTSGWFCGAVPSVERFSDVEVLQPEGQWMQLEVPRGVKALVVVNLQSYAGGRNIWGPKMKPKSIAKHGWKTPVPSDGMLEVVGFTHGAHAAMIMATGAVLAHGKRLAQVAGIRVRLRDPSRPDGAPGAAFLQVDGEPWQQHIPSSSKDDPVLVEVTHLGVSKLLLNMADDGATGPKKISSLISPERQQQYLHPVFSGASDCPAGGPSLHTPAEQSGLEVAHPSYPSSAANGSSLRSPFATATLGQAQGGVATAGSGTAPRGGDMAASVTQVVRPAGDRKADSVDMALVTH